MLIIDSFVPPENQDHIEGLAQWNEVMGEWQVPGMAYTGNAMRKVAAAQAAAGGDDAPEDFSKELEKQYFM